MTIFSITQINIVNCEQKLVWTRVAGYQEGWCWRQDWFQKVWTSSSPRRAFKPCIASIFFPLCTFLVTHVWFSILTMVFCVFDVCDGRKRRRVDSISHLWMMQTRELLELPWEAYEIDHGWWDYSVWQNSVGRISCWLVHARGEDTRQENSPWAEQETLGW